MAHHALNFLTYVCGVIGTESITGMWQYTRWRFAGLILRFHAVAATPPSRSAMNCPTPIFPLLRSARPSHPYEPAGRMVEMYVALPQ